MKLFFEQYPYPASCVKGILDANLYTEYNDKFVIPYVGYFYSPKIEDCIFILPKIFIRKTTQNGEGASHNLAFGKYKPENIVDVNSKEILESQDNELIFSLSVWLYNAISHFIERHRDNKITDSAYVQNVVSNKGNNEQTFLDIVLSLIKFHKEHKNLFTFITILNKSGKSNINWTKTITQTPAILKRGIPFYSQVIAKKNVINYDEEIVVLFYSVLYYLKYKYHYRIDKGIKYKVISPNIIESYICTGKGLRILNQIRKKYFTDDFVALWNLLKVFFERSYKVSTKKYEEEKLLVRNFNIVFEDMIDQLIGDSKSNLLDGSLKDQEDGKRIDHIYKDDSLIPNSEIYYIGDSKYYLDSNNIEGSAFYKQYTYAKNVIQVCMNIFDGGDGKEKLGNLRYVDEKTEGYNITPNFFIRGNISNFNNVNFSDLELKNETPCDIRKFRSIHWKDRLFDRDTLILQVYNINFLYVLSNYISGSSDKSMKDYIHKMFRKDIMKTLDRNYYFYKVTPFDLDYFVEKYFRLLYGKMFRGNDNDDFIWLAFEKGSKSRLSDLEKIKGDCSISKTGLLQEDKKGFFFFFFQNGDEDN